ncbi:MAG TPA: MFS transporter, partial [Thermomicrobiaceae bacterium]|nr:MFS transporter [Thermomicrobiaceae bacterium]
GILLFYWRGPSRRAGLVNVDLPGALVLVAGLICLCLGITAGGDTSVAPRALGAAPNPLAAYRWPLLAAGLVLLAIFTAVEYCSSNPLVPLSLVARRHFTAANLTNFLVGAALMTAMVNVPLIVVLIVASGRDSTVSAELLAAFSLAMAITALIGGKIADRAGFVISSAFGLVISAIGFYLMSHWSTHLHEGRMAIDLAIAGAGLGLVLAPVAAAAIDSARESDIGIASGLVIVARLLGMTIGISALTAWSVARLNSALQALPTITQKPGESLAHYLQRQENLATQQAIPATVHVIRDTFGVAAVLCLIAIIPVLFLANREPKTESADEGIEPG